MVMSVPAVVAMVSMSMVLAAMTPCPSLRLRPGPHSSSAVARSLPSYRVAMKRLLVRFTAAHPTINVPRVSVRQLDVVVPMVMRVITPPILCPLASPLPLRTRSLVPYKIRLLVLPGHGAANADAPDWV